MLYYSLYCLWPCECGSDLSRLLHCFAKFLLGWCRAVHWFLKYYWGVTMGTLRRDQLLFTTCQVTLNIGFPEQSVIHQTYCILPEPMLWATQHSRNRILRRNEVSIDRCFAAKLHKNSKKWNKHLYFRQTESRDADLHYTSEQNECNRLHLRVWRRQIRER